MIEVYYDKGKERILESPKTHIKNHCAPRSDP